MPVKVICSCSVCFRNEIINASGHRQPGKWVAPSTRARHSKKDQSLHETGKAEDAAEKMVEELEEYIGRISSARNTIYITVCTVVTWLHLVCGLSRASCSQLLYVLKHIVQMAIHLGSLFSSLQTGTSVDSSLFDPLSLPLDVRSAMSTISIEPDIIRSVCCPKCFAAYKLNSMPDICPARETPRAKSCGAELWIIRSSRKGPQRLPQRLYSTQSFDSWLQYFLSRPGIEEIIDKSYAHKPSNGNMRSIWDSPAWQCLPNNFSSTPGNLTFSYYIDWFNPFTNKIAGKNVSCGAIMMFCLNLPFDIQYLPENTFFAGLTPPPKEPSMITITALADPIIDQLVPMWSGRLVKTHRHPEGIVTRAAILARTGDLLAVRKAFGFAGVKAHNFCSFCKLQSSNMDDLNYLSWESRNQSEVLSAARSWKAATTKKKREEIFKEYGVRWSSLHRLPYGDPVQHVVLGLMHNWIEGVLQHHVRVRWGLGLAIASTKTKTNKKKSPNNTTTAQHPLEGMLQVSDIEGAIFDEELELLHKESQQYQDVPTHPSRLHSEASMLSLDDERTDSDDSDFNPGADLDSENPCYDDFGSDGSECDDENDDSGVDFQCVFTDHDLSRIRHCVANAAIPSWLERPPTNLGKKNMGKFKAHGKLKADQWFTLVSIFLPLVLPEIWSVTPTDKKHAYQKSLLENFHHLVICTNTVCAYSVTPESPDIYLNHYVQYQTTSQTLFPLTGTRPNHHYAMHNADLMRFWGPLIRISEFAGERHNGSLQKINTNNHLWEMDLTMLRQICRRGRLMALLRSSETGTQMARLLNKSKAREENLISTTLKTISLNVYDAILAYVNKGVASDPFRHIHAYPHPQNARVLPISATPMNHFQHKGRGYSTFGTHPGNSSVHFISADQGGPDSGYIESIWKYHVPQIGLSRIFIVISCHQMLSLQDSCHNPYPSYSGFLANIAYTRNPNNLKTVIIEPEDIVGHVAYYRCPPKTFGIQASITIFVNSLHRYRD